MKREWFIDGENVRFGEVIKRAQAYGYESDSGIYQTSIACRYLEKNGHKVECKEIAPSEG